MNPWKRMLLALLGVVLGGCTLRVSLGPTVGAEGVGLRLAVTQGTLVARRGDDEAVRGVAVAPRLAGEWTHREGLAGTAGLSLDYVWLPRPRQGRASGLRAGVMAGARFDERTRLVVGPTAAWLRAVQDKGSRVDWLGVEASCELTPTESPRTSGRCALGAVFEINRIHEEDIPFY